MLQKNFHVQEWSMDNWPYWMFEENIKIVNEIIEEEDKNREKEKEQTNIPDTSSMMKSAQNLTSNIPKF